MFMYTRKGMKRMSTVDKDTVWVIQVSSRLHVGVNSAATLTSQHSQGLLWDNILIKNFICEERQTSMKATFVCLGYRDIILAHTLCAASVCKSVLHLLLFAWGSYLRAVSSNEMLWVRGSRRSFLFLAQSGCFSPSSPTALGWSDSPRCAPHMPRSHLWSLWGSLPSSPPPAPSSPALRLLPSLPFSLPPAPSSLPVIVPAGAGRAQLSLALRGTRQSHSLCCWPCWCQGVRVFLCWTELGWKKPGERRFYWVYVKTKHAPNEPKTWKLKERTTHMI